MIKALQNHLFVEIESKFNDEIVTDKGVKLFLSTKKFSMDDEHDSSNYKPSMINRHYGKVIGTPIRLTDEIKLIQVDPGLPCPQAYVSNEKIKEINERMNGGIDSWSSLNSFTHEWKTMADFEMEAKDGDKIYFDYLTTIIEGNHIPEIGENVYKLGYNNAICVVRENVIIPIAGHVLVEPIWEDGVEELGNGKRGKITKSGIVSELHDKPEPLRGRVMYLSNPMKGEVLDLKQGDKIIYLPHSDFEMEIEGKTYYVMKYWEIIAKFE